MFSIKIKKNTEINKHLHFFRPTTFLNTEAPRNLFQLQSKYTPCDPMYERLSDLCDILEFFIKMEKKSFSLLVYKMAQQSAFGEISSCMPSKMKT